VQQHDLDALLAQRGDQRVVLRLLLGERRADIAAPIGAGRGIAEGAELRDVRECVDDAHLLARPVHQHEAEAPDIGVAAPAAAPDEALLRIALEARRRLGGEALDQHVVAVVELAHRHGHGSVLPVSLRAGVAARGRAAAAAG
jgi:hypothetical protein